MDFKAEVRLTKPLNIRSGGPYLSQTIARQEEIGTSLKVVERVDGENVKGVSFWYREEGTGYYFWGGGAEIVLRFADAVPAAAAPGAIDPSERLSAHFTLEELVFSEVAMRKGIDNTPSADVVANLRRLAQTLEEVRSLLGGAPILISSGYRSLALNTEIRGSQSSVHPLGLAADFTAPSFGTVRDIVQTIANSPLPFDQLIYEYGRWVHLGLARNGTPRRELHSNF